MKRSIADTRKKAQGRGRPKTGIGANVGLRLYQTLEQRLDDWILDQGELDLGRPEAIRRILDEKLPPAKKKENPTAPPSAPVRRKQT